MKFLEPISNVLEFHFTYSVQFLSKSVGQFSRKAFLTPAGAYIRNHYSILVANLYVLCAAGGTPFRRL